MERRVNAALRIFHCALLCMIAAACLLFGLYWFLSTEPKHGTKYPDEIDKYIKSRFFRTDAYYGSVLIFQTLPFVIVAILGYAVIFLRARIEHTNGAAAACENKSQNLRLSLGTFPLWVSSPLGVLTGTDAIFIAGTLFTVFYHLGRILHIEFEILDEEYAANPEEFEASLALTKIAYASYYIGAVSNLPFSLLWFPVSRGSPFLRLLRVPYERAVKYHIWLGVLTLFLLTVHGICYIAYFVGAHEAKQIIAWNARGESCSVVAGVVGLAAGLVMWITSLPYFRRNRYEVFFAGHHLYVVFLLFWMYHVIWTIHFFSIPVLLFIVDRFLRFVQSCHAVTVLAAKVLESGAMELRFSRNNYSSTGGVQPVYQALSSWYVKLPSLPRFLGKQWHAFSVMSSPADEKHEISIVMKPVGGWTNSLHRQLTHTSSKGNPEARVSKCPFSFKAGIEGPYGHESDFYLEYKSLVLVGGGIGVTPLLAVLRDVLHRYRLQQQQQHRHGKSHHNLPTSIQLHHCVRTTDELCVLNSVSPSKILPEYQNLGLDIQIHAYVTTSRNPEDEENTATKCVGTKNSNKILSSSEIEMKSEETYDLASYSGVQSNGSANRSSFDLEFEGDSRVEGISPISPTGEMIWVASVALASMIGFFVLWGFSNVLWIRNVEDKVPNYSRAHLILGAMLLGTGIFGGAVTAGWYYKSYVERRRLGGRSNVSRTSDLDSRREPKQVVVDERGSSEAHVGSPWIGTLRFGRRPSWEDLFRGFTAQYEGQNVGVLVSGSANMLQEVAGKCRKHTSVNFKTLVGADESQGVVFHFHPLSFEL